MRDALELFAAKHVGGAPDKLVGIVSVRDLADVIAEGGLQPGSAARDGNKPGDDVERRSEA